MKPCIKKKSNIQLQKQLNKLNKAVTKPQKQIGAAASGRW